MYDDELTAWRRKFEARYETDDGKGTDWLCFFSVVLTSLTCNSRCCCDDAKDFDSKVCL